jgi:hypothetical protein
MMLHCMSLLVLWFLDAGDDETIGTLSWPASKKRQGTKSREVGHRLSSERIAMPAASPERHSRPTAPASLPPPMTKRRGRDGKPLAVLEGHTDNVTSAVFSDGARILTASEDKTARLIL